ncbi:MAG: hypothetical protein Q7K03_02175 [Dehalococcoidia bacterium]|nr:hypothetical protein [Dehalococcoidia bacterium]
MGSHVLTVRVDEDLYQEVTRLMQDGHPLSSVLRMGLGAAAQVASLQAELRRREIEEPQVIAVLDEMMDDRARLEKQVADLTGRYWEPLDGALATWPWPKLEELLDRAQLECNRRLIQRLGG